MLGILRRLSDPLRRVVKPLLGVGLFAVVAIVAATRVAAAGPAGDAPQALRPLLVSAINAVAAALPTSATTSVLAPARSLTTVHNAAVNRVLHVAVSTASGATTTSAIPTLVATVGGALSGTVDAVAAPAIASTTASKLPSMAGPATAPAWQSSRLVGAPAGAFAAGGRGLARTSAGATLLSSALLGLAALLLVAVDQIPPGPLLPATPAPLPLGLGAGAGGAGTGLPIWTRWWLRSRPAGTSERAGCGPPSRGARRETRTSSAARGSGDSRESSPGESSQEDPSSPPSSPEAAGGGGGAAHRGGGCRPARAAHLRRGLTGRLRSVRRLLSSNSRTGGVRATLAVTAAPSRPRSHPRPAAGCGPGALAPSASRPVSRPPTTSSTASTVPDWGAAADIDGLLTVIVLVLLGLACGAGLLALLAQRTSWLTWRTRSRRRAGPARQRRRTPHAPGVRTARGVRSRP